MAEGSQLVHLIVGLGNPGREYARTRHNIGYMCVDRFAARHGLEFLRRKANADVAAGVVAGDPVVVAKPRTFMNESGRSVGELVRFHKVPLDSLIVVYDDLDLPLGTIRIRKLGGHGGHNGMRSILAHLGDQGFPRIRVGIGRPPGAGAANPDVAARYVLSPFREEERPVASEVCDAVADALDVYLAEGIEAAMNRFNKGVGG